MKGRRIRVGIRPWHWGGFPLKKCGNDMRAGRLTRTGQILDRPE